MNFNRLNVITGWLLGLMATVVYVMTLEPTMPFWDCGEFISSVNKLEVGHPPGAPLFMLIGRVFSAFVAPANVPFMINLLSAICSGLTITFLFWTITHLARKFVPDTVKELSQGQLAAIIGSGVVGSLIYAFSDTFWFSGVEAEVYAMSSLSTAVVFWAILKWESTVDASGDLRWVIFISYLMGLSIGIHLLNLLTIPALCMVFYYKNYKFSWKGLILTGIVSLLFFGLMQTGVIISFVKLAGSYELAFVNNAGAPFNSGGIFYFVLIAAFIVYALWYTTNTITKIRTTILLVLFGLIPTVPTLLNLGSITGTTLLYGILLAVVLYGIYYANKKARLLLNTLVLSVGVAIIGYTSYATIIIRSQANPPMDENNPENAFALLAYLNREQYGDRPLLYGQYFNTPQDMENPYRDGADVWIKSYSVRDQAKNKLVLSARARWESEQYIQAHPEQKLMLVEEYIESGEKKASVPNYDERFCGTFPRMYSSQANHIADYKEWSNYQGWNTKKGKDAVTKKEQNIDGDEYALNYYSQTNQMPQGFEDEAPGAVLNRLNRNRQKMIPTKGEDFSYFAGYQLNWMYWRYFMWNFAGRQNDRQGNGEFTDGNWISGVPFIDEARLGNQKALTEIESENKGRNMYFFLPLILGLIGLVFQLLKNPKDFSVIGVLFFLTGIAIVIYVNQTPQQPRERDYAYAGSFYAFAIWIGLGVYALYYAATSMTFKQIGTLAAMTIGGSMLIYGMEMIVGSEHGFGYSLLFMSIVSTALFALMAVINTGLKGDTALKGILATLVVLPIPFIMVAENWDDHTRAKRETGLAMAKNYLQSLEPNAIVFTNGDNDTFPLWYAQEVEGFRTDVRVVNLSLLNTDWYIDQMKRRAWESAPVPFKIPEQKYRQGTRDVMFLDPDKESKDYITLEEGFKVLLDDSKFKENGRNKIPYLPSYKFKIPVDAATQEQFKQYLQPGDSLVSEITWAIADGKNKPRSYITKAQMMVLDLLRNMDWSRPVYFAVTTGGDAYMGLERYFQLEGLAYRLTPIYHKEGDNPNLEGGIGTDIMYRNMMERFSWGNMDTETLNLDENNRRMTTNLRLQFNHLADALIQENKKDSALNVLNKSLAVMPEKNVPYEQPQIMWQVAELYFEAGDKEKGLALAKRLIELSNQEVEFYNSLDEDRQVVIHRDIMTRVQINDRLIVLLKENFPDDPEVKQLDEQIAAQREAFGVQSYEEYRQKQKEAEEAQKQMEAMRSQKVSFDGKGVTIQKPVK